MRIGRALILIIVAVLLCSCAACSNSGLPANSGPGERSTNDSHSDEVHEHSFENNYVIDDNDEVVEVNAEDIYDAENKIFSFPECSWNEDFKALETHFGVEKMPFYPEQDPQLWVELVVSESFSLRLIPFFQDMSVYSGAVQKQFELLAEDTLVDVNTERAGMALVELYTGLCGEPEMDTTDYSAMGSPLVDTGYRWSLASADGVNTGMDIIFTRNGEDLESLDILIYILAD